MCFFSFPEPRIINILYGWSEILGQLDYVLTISVSLYYIVAFILPSHLCKLLRIRQLLRIHMNRQNLTGAQRSSNFYIFIRSFFLWYKIMFIKYAVICWKLWEKKCWVECEVNRSTKLSIESNMPTKKKMRPEDTHLVWADGGSCLGRLSFPTMH